MNPGNLSLSGQLLRPLFFSPRLCYNGYALARPGNTPEKGRNPMKKTLMLLLVLSLLLCGCGAQPAETTAPITEAPTLTTEAPTEVPTEAPTEMPTEAPTEAPTEPPVPTNPLTGEVLEAPNDSRTFAVTINNVPGAMPMYGVSKADLFFEMFVNDYCTRGLAMFSDIREVSSVGSVRSLRLNFSELCKSYDAVVVHAGGRTHVMEHMRQLGVPNVAAETYAGDYYFRDQGRLNAGYAWEHCLFVKGAATRDFAESRDIRVTREENADYGLCFTQDGTPENGEAAAAITIGLKQDSITKYTYMQYDADRGAYRFYQYGDAMYDAAEKQDILFENVIVMFCPVENEGVYHIADLIGSGEGYFACGGQIIPILWSHDSLEEPILFTLTDGTPLELGVGSSYIAIAPLTSTVEWE